MTGVRWCVALLAVLSTLPIGRTYAQRPRSGTEVIELGVDAGASFAIRTAGVPSQTVPVVLRLGWLDDTKRGGLEFRAAYNDKRMDEQRRAQFAGSFRLSWRLLKQENGIVSFGGPYVLAGAGVSSVRNYVDDSTAPRFRFLPSTHAGIGMRFPIGNSALRLELVSGYDSGYKTPESSYYVPTRVTHGVMVGYSYFKQKKR